MEGSSRLPSAIDGPAGACYDTTLVNPNPRDDSLKTTVADPENWAEIGRQIEEMEVAVHIQDRGLYLPDLPF